MAYPVHPDSAAYMAYILNGQDKHLHPDFGGSGQYGIPYIVVDGTQARYRVIPEYADESDPDGTYGFNYPIPPGAPVENGSDAHVLVVDSGNCKLYELYAASFSSSAWHCGSAAIFDLGSNVLRPDYRTSADAAGLPIFPGLVRYDEVQAGEITHAIRGDDEDLNQLKTIPGSAFEVVYTGDLIH